MANRIVLELLADSNNLLKTLDAAQRSVDKFVRSSDAAGQSLGGGVNRALDAFTDLAKGGASAAGVLAGGLVAAATAAVLMTTSAGKQVEAIDQLSQKTGIAVQSIQGWSVIMAENGFQAESLTAGMRTLSKQMIEARNPASQAASTFEEMGVSISALGSTESTIRAVADRFKDMADGPEKARLAVQLFGKSGLDMIPILNRGGAAFDESRRMAERFVAVLSTEQVAALNAADDAADRLGVSLQGLKLQLAATFAGTVTTGIEAVTNGIASLTNITRNYSAALEDVKKSHPIIFSTMPGMASAMAAVKASQMAPPPSSLPSGPQDGHVAEFALAKGQQQEELGLRIRNQLIEKYKLLVSEQHAQEALGRVSIAIIQRETAARNEAFALQIQQAEEINNLQFQKPTTSTAFDEHLKAVQALMGLIPELTFQEASLLAVQNAENGQRVLDGSRERLQLLNETARALSLQADTEQAYADHAAAGYQRLGSLFGDVATARQYAFDAIDARTAASMAELDAQLAKGDLVWSAYYQKVVQLDLQADTQRRAVAERFPTFFEQQMRTITAANTFSTGQIIGTWTGGVANAIVNHGQFVQQAMKATEVAVIQGVLNMGVQMAAQWALNASVELGILSATEAAKLGLKTASNATIVAGEAATATASMSIWAAASAAIIGAFATVGVGFAAIGATMVGVLTAVGTFVMGVLSAIAEALTATVFGIPYAGAILLGIAAIAVALAATGNLGFKDGGIGNFGSGTPATLHGQEAIIPLNKRGASFMQSVMGGGGSNRPIIVPVSLNGRQIAIAQSDDQMSALRKMGVLST